MKLFGLISQHPWLSSLVVLAPCVIQIAILLAGASEGRASSWSLALAKVAIPLVSAIVGILVAYVLGFALNKWEQFTNVHAIVFALSWSIVFGYLNVFTFLMGMGVSTPSESSELLQKLVLNLVVSTPFAALVSLVVCVLVTGLAMFITKMASGS